MLLTCAAMVATQSCGQGRRGYRRARVVAAPCGVHASRQSHSRPRCGAAAAHLKIALAAAERRAGQRAARLVHELPRKDGGIVLVGNTSGHVDAREDRRDVRRVEAARAGVGEEEGRV